MSCPLYHMFFLRGGKLTKVPCATEVCSNRNETVSSISTRRIQPSLCTNGSCIPKVATICSTHGVTVFRIGFGAANPFLSISIVLELVAQYKHSSDYKV